MNTCKLMIEQNLTATWTCNSRVIYMDEVMLQLMGKSGCKLISWGIGSGSQQALQHTRKGAYPD